jgi:site-specific recombinase XerD
MNYMAQSRSFNTVRAYRSDWHHFEQWCENHGTSALPASAHTLCLYITDLVEQGMHTSTIRRRMTGITSAHRAAQLPTPVSSVEVRAVWSGIRRTHGIQQRGKKPILTDDLRRMVRHLPADLKGLRDHALLLVGFAGAFRRSELVAIKMEDLEFTRSGLVIQIRKSKTDQDGSGRKIGIAYGSDPLTCPVRVLQDWIDAACIESGPVFRRLDRWGHVDMLGIGDRMVAHIVKAAVAGIGLPPEEYAGHSLRSGFATAAAQNGAGERAIMNQTGHRSEMMVRRYIRDGNLFNDNASTKLGL